MKQVVRIANEASTGALRKIQISIGGRRVVTSPVQQLDRISLAASKLLVGAGATYLGQLLNVGDWADEPATVDRVMYQPAGSLEWSWIALSDIVGLDTEALSDYLAKNKYATQPWVESLGYATKAQLDDHVGDKTVHITSAERVKWNTTASDLSAILGSNSDGVINKWNEIVSFLDTYTEADTLASLLSNKADKTTTIQAGAGLTGGGPLSGDVSLSLAKIGTPGIYAKVKVDEYGRVTGGETGDVNDLFEKVNIGTEASPRWAIRAKLGLYSDEFISALGVSEGGTSGGGASTLGELVNVDEGVDGKPAAARVLVQLAGATHWTTKLLSDIVGLDTAALANYLTMNKYATQTWVDGRYLKLEALADYVTLERFTALSDLVGLKLDKSTFDELFEKVNIGTEASPRWAIRAKLGLYSDEFISALGVSEGDTSGGGASTLGELVDVSLSSPLNGDVLQYNGSKWVNVAMPTIRPDLTDYVTLNTAQTITAAKTFESIVYRKTNTLTRTLFNSDTGYDYLVFGDTAGYTYLQGNTIGFQNSLGKTNVTIANDGVLTAVKLIKVGGLATEVLMADGASADVGTLFLKLADATGDVKDSTKFVTSDNGGDASVKTYYRRPATALWNYIQGKTGALYITALGTSGNYLTWTKNGVVSNITVPYASQSAYAGAVRDSDHYTISTRRGSANINFNNDAGLRHFLATSSMMVGKPMNDGHIIHMEWDNSLSWAAQIAVPNSSSASMQWRAQDSTTWANWRTLLDTSNYTDTLDGRYVNKTGDTMTGALTLQTGKDVKLVFDNTDGEKYSRLSFRETGVEYAALTAQPDVFVFDGLPVKATYFTAGSTNLCSNLNADLLDGLHSTAFARCDQWQRVDLDTLNGFGFMKNYANDDATPERHYPIKEAGLLIYGEAAYSSANQIYGSYRSNRWFARGGGGSPTDKTTWREFAFLDSNIASASKLANDAAFTAWGQTFFQNGVPRSISGAMTGVGQITATTLAIATTYDNTWSDGKNSHPWYGYDHRFHNTGVYSTTISDFYGITLRTSAGYISMDADGRVGIGTTEPTQKLHVNGNVLVSGDAYYRTEGRAGNSWNNGYGALSVGIMHNGSQTPLLVAYRYNGGTWTTPTTDRLFAMELLNYGSQLRFGFGGATKFYFESDGTFHSENGIWSEGYVSALGQNTSSDERLKRIIRPITLTVDEIAKAPIYVFEWINGAGIEIGSIAQYWQSVLPEGVRSRKDSYLSMSGNLGLVAAICNARHISDHARRIAALERDKSKLEDDNRALKEENLEIKRQLQQLTVA